VEGAVRIRLATPRDTDALVSLWLGLVEHHRRLDPEYPLLPGLREQLRREIERGIRVESCEISLAEVEGRACGFLFAELEGGRDALATGADTAWIHELFVVEEARGRGVGRALVARADRFFQFHGGPRTAVRVESANRDALAFWNHLGFAERARVLERPALGPSAEADGSGRGRHAGTASTRPRD